jgi:hypothetical protein
MKCGWCLKEKRLVFYRAKREWRCKCSNDYRTPVERRRDAVLNKYGDDPAAYTPRVLAKLSKDGLLDVSAAFCPAGKLSLAETKAREQAQITGEAA